MIELLTSCKCNNCLSAGICYSVKTKTELQIIVRLTGIEPALRKELDPKSSASANSATSADATAKLVFFLRTHKKSGKIYGVLSFPSFPDLHI